MKFLEEFEEEKIDFSNIQEKYKIPDTHLKKYGLDRHSYLDLLEKQSGRCKICGIKPKSYQKSLAVDHCHKSKIVRGLLCTNCNLGIGNFRDNIELLKSAISYLEDTCQKKTNGSP